jgi:hypothetical protein
MVGFASTLDIGALEYRQFLTTRNFRVRLFFRFNSFASTRTLKFGGASNDSVFILVASSLYLLGFTAGNPAVESSKRV